MCFQRGPSAQRGSRCFAFLESLTHVANDGYAFAIAWHLVAFIAIVALVGGWRPSSRLAGLLLAIPFVSVSVASWSFGNPFNGFVFAALAVALALVAALRENRGQVQLGLRWSQFVALLWKGLDDRPWSTILALITGCYAIFGSVPVGVWIDAAPFRPWGSEGSREVQRTWLLH
jgi:hypothetical protein